MSFKESLSCLKSGLPQPVCRLRKKGNFRHPNSSLILNEIGTVLSHVESILMDEQTLLAHRHFWGQEPNPTTSQLPQLTQTEQRLYQDLQQNRFGKKLRLEQERVGMGMVEKVLWLNDK